jgi:hypothetical protein
MSMPTEKEVDAGLRENLRLGYIAKAGKNKAGEQLYRITRKGSRYVEAMLSGAKNRKTT